MLTDRTRTTVIFVVTTVWAANFIAGLVPALDYEPDQAINGIFMGIVGGLFALGARKNDGGPGSGTGAGGDGSNRPGSGSLGKNGGDSISESSTASAEEPRP